MTLSDNNYTEIIQMLKYLSSFIWTSKQLVHSTTEGNNKTWNRKCNQLVGFSDLVTDTQKILEQVDDSRIRGVVEQILKDARNIPALTEYDNIYIMYNWWGLLQLQNTRRFEAHEQQVKLMVPDGAISADNQKLLDLGLAQKEELWPIEIRNMIVNRIYYCP